MNGVAKPLFTLATMILLVTFFFGVSHDVWPIFCQAFRSAPYL